MEARMGPCENRDTAAASLGAPGGAAGEAGVSRAGAGAPAVTTSTTMQFLAGDVAQRAQVRVPGSACERNDGVV
eukprot:scaffold142838_cov17-Tisochrysis_lutea.AAC.1